MAPPRGREEPPLERQLFEEPYRFDFFQAVRLLERLQPGRVPIGREGPARREVVRVGTRASLSFPPSVIHHLEGEPADSDAPPRMTVAFLGLIGPLGVLPRAYTELVMERVRAGDRTLAAFLDLFHHRIASLFFRAWEKYRVASHPGREVNDPFASYLYALSGFGIASLRNRSDVPDAPTLFYAGMFAQRRRPAVMLEGLLKGYFGLPIEVQQFAGRWLPFEPEDRSRVGRSGPHHGLGSDLILGSRVWDEQGTFRLRVGPLSFGEFRALLPDGTSFRALSQMTRRFVDGGLDFDVQLILRADEVPPSVLTSDRSLAPRLGRHAWVVSRPMTEDADQAVFPAGV